MLKGRHILVLEDEALLRKSLCRYLESLGAEAYPAESLAEARELRASVELDYAILDINLPDGNGLDLLRDPGFSSNTRVVVMTAEGGIRTAVEAIRSGASDYLSKPFDPEELPVVFRRISRQAAKTRIEQFEREKRSGPDESLFIGERMQVVRNQLDKILEADHRLESRLPPVLIEGETGTGKSTLARWLHENGPRREGPLIEINCSTLPESLAESELFGHERGAFTDARKERIGLFEAADSGSLFLDEIASLPLPLQAKVLTAIEDRRIRRVGGNNQRHIDVRLVAASIHPLQDLVREGSFREDLYHRLNLLQLRIPPLREYPQDIPALAEHLLQSLRKRYRMPEAHIPKEALGDLMAYSWPGNVRELLHELERSLIFTGSGPLDFSHLRSTHTGDRREINVHALLNPGWRVPDADFNLEEAVRDLTHRVINRTLEEEGGNVSAAARRLGVSRDFIRYRLDS